MFSNWIEGYKLHTRDLPTTPLYSEWAAISAVAACLQRRCYTEIVRQRQFANMYILLIGPPGSGKTVAIKNVRNVIRQHESIRICPMRITKEAFYTELADCGQSHIDITTGAQTLEFHHSLNAMIDEFGTFVKKGDLDFQTDLADMYDCPDPFEYKTKNSGVYFANQCWLNMVAACTPRHIREVFTDDALEFGLPARIIMVSETASIRHDTLFTQPSEDGSESGGETELLRALTKDVGRMLQLNGSFSWTTHAAAFLEDWYADDLRPFPMDPKLQHYVTRRLTHVSKLSILHSAAEASCEQIISETDVIWAKKTLLDVESKMHTAIKHLGENPYFSAMNNCRAMVIRRYTATKNSVPEFFLRQNLEREVPPYLIIQIIDGLVAAQHLSVEPGTETPHRRFLPKQAHTEEVL